MANVIVVGGGLSGLSAAHTVYERGGNVTVLEKNGFFGGNSTKATSGINGAGTKSQAGLGIKDSTAAFFADTKKSARELARDDLIEVLTGRSGDAVEWLINRFGLDLSKVSRLGGHSFERTHRGGAQFPGMTITVALMDKLEELAEAEPDRVKIIKKANVKQLIKEGEKVVGVEYEYQGKRHEAHGPVVLATGGYAADFAKDGVLAKYRPELLDLPTTNGDHCTGDGLKMALGVGANGIDLNMVQVHPTGLIDVSEQDAKVKFLAAEALRGCGGLLLDGEGNRFADELGHRDYVTQRIWDNGKYPVRLILNGQASEAIKWHCKHYTGRGLMKQFNTVEEVAKEMNLPVDKVQGTFNNYMEIVKDPKKDPFGKKFFDNTDWTNNAGPFHVALMTPVLHYTMGGLEGNTKAEILDTKGKPISGLFASGEVVGGVHGANRLGGSSLLGCVVFGRVAGDSASAYLFKEVSKNGGGSSGAVSRLNQVNGHLSLPSTTISVDPNSQQVFLTINYGQGSGSASSTSSSSSEASASSGDGIKPNGPSTAEQPANEKEAVTPPEEKKDTKKEYTLEEVAKHNKKDDCWVIIHDQVLDVTDFAAEHPGGPKAIMLYAGRDATEEFGLVHDDSIWRKHGPRLTIGTVKA
ncbi:uncharacterized protein JCM15063_005353 [Sporobolomyces koalae]|uniref:uncharacterized protein n=1 Tax=Sporobolomyces koalae TaxID=500713 RepID=UPI0031708C05